MRSLSLSSLTKASGILAISCCTNGPDLGWGHLFLEELSKGRHRRLFFCLPEKVGPTSLALEKGMRRIRNRSSDLLLGFPAARQPHRSNAHGCQCRGNGSRQILTLLPQRLAHLRGSYGESKECRVRSSCFSQIHLLSFSSQLFIGHLQKAQSWTHSTIKSRERPLPTLVTWRCVERELWNCQAMKEPVQHSPLCSQQTVVKGFGDGPAIPIHGFTQNSKTLQETRAGLTLGHQKTDWA